MTYTNQNNLKTLFTLVGGLFSNKITAQTNQQISRRHLMMGRCLHEFEAAQKHGSAVQTSCKRVYGHSSLNK